MDFNFNFNRVTEADDLTNQVPVNEPFEFNGDVYVNAVVTAEMGSDPTFTRDTNKPNAEYGSWSGGSQYLAVIFNKANGEIELLDNTNAAKDGSLVGWLPPFVDGAGDVDESKKPLGVLPADSVVPVKLTGRIMAMFTNVDVAVDTNVASSATDGQIAVSSNAPAIDIVGATTVTMVDVSVSRVGSIFVPNRAYTHIA